ncbi:hypothetical protein PPYR_13146 [Photinus pyralis]|uniref:ENTH domain-containing protein n=1 Tax=Photinus pyralis TaxID=7054 RepID=A0A1Y1LCF8_PHOPY|nr:epsin-2 [Photinus pyralis]XP_031352547.1 epsin-2 [Photinus pyralis]KAB0793526.1 hypothetical protein PPYR_13146 [Photinus pyralis]
MQVNVAGLRRTIKNVAHNYSDAQKKVREATSNDHWGPSSTLMAEIADLTYNVLAFTEIMQMIWKRLNDNGRNWRHVYKALVLLEYLIKTGSEKVGQQCKENIFVIQTLKDFQYLEEGKDQGQNVREKAKQLVNLLKDDERLKNERARALKAKERFAQTASGFGSDGGLDTPSSPRFPAFGGGGGGSGGSASSLGSGWNGSKDSAELPKELEFARPQTAGEEELQLQLALAMSREEAEQEEQKKRSDDVRLQLALSQSQQDFKVHQDYKPKSHVLDLLDVNLTSNTAASDPWVVPQPPPRAQVQPWQGNALSSPTHNSSQEDPWLPPLAPPPKADPWNPHNGMPMPSVPPIPRGDPWSPTSQSSSTDLEDFDAITNRNRTSPKTNGTTHSNNNTPDPFEVNLLGESLGAIDTNPSTGATKRTPQSFLGDNAGLVNLDNLVTATTKQTTASTAPPAIVNPFSDPQPPKPTINQIKQPPFGASQLGTSAPTYGSHMLGFTYPSNYAGDAPPINSGSQFASSAGNLGQTQASNDPWAPASSTNANLSGPWMKPEQANPFLS